MSGGNALINQSGNNGTVTLAGQSAGNILVDQSAPNSSVSLTNIGDFNHVSFSSYGSSLSVTGAVMPVTWVHVVQ